MTLTVYYCWKCGDKLETVDRNTYNPMSGEKGVYRRCPKSRWYNSCYTEKYLLSRS